MSRGDRAALALVLLLTAALVIAPWRGHVDDIDAQVYEVVARNMVADGTWFDLRFLPSVWPRFREHLPFSFWPAAATIRLAGEGAVNSLYALVTLTMVFCTGWLASRLHGGFAGITAALVLGTCESIWQYGGRFLLEPPLLLFATLAAGAALLPGPRWGSAAVFGALSVLAKGPFGLIPLACVAAGRSASERSWRFLLRGGLAAFAATLPAAAFLLYDRWFGEGTWWSGYLQQRLLGWASGASPEGLAERWLPLRVIVGRFWPGLPLVLYGFWRARRERHLQPLALACALGALLLCVPERKWGNHTYVLFPLLAILAGAAVTGTLDRALSPLVRRRIVQGLAVATAAAWVLSIAGLGRLVLQPPCVVSTDFAAELNSIPAGSAVPVVSPDLEWLLMGALASERRLIPTRLGELSSAQGASIAIVREGTSFRWPWSEKIHARGWTLLRR
jgi:4-amino-4-deoxy-L-arabinose transferase-like glycosyltransferase